MAAVITFGQMERWGKYTIQHGTLAMDSSYPTGGEDISAAEMTETASQVIDVICDPLASNATYKLWWDATTDVIYANTRADGAEVADTTDLSAVIVPIWIMKLK